MRIMTTNIWGDYFGNPVCARQDDLLSVYTTYQPDVIGFQEVTKNWQNSTAFSALCENYDFVGTELSYSANYVPMAVKKDLALLAKGYEPLYQTPDVSKGITWAVLQDKNGKTFGACNTHFWWKSGAEHDAVREKNAIQLCDIMKYLRSRFSCPIFAFGDMNCNISSTVFEIIYKANGITRLFDIAEIKDLVSSHHGDPAVDEKGRWHGTKTSDDYTRSIDHIISLGDGFKVKSYKIAEDQRALDATDHSPVFADIEL